MELFVAFGLISGRYNKDIYSQAVAYEMNGDYVNAYTSYEKISQYRRLNVNERMKEIEADYKYQLAGQKVDEGDLISALQIYNEIRYFKDSDEIIYNLSQRLAEEERKDHLDDI